jgi:hypothetical protein
MTMNPLPAAPVKIPSILYSILAVAIPVSLGFGLIYLYSMGKMDAGGVAITLAAMVAVIPLAELLRRWSRETATRTCEGRHSPKGWSR